MSTTIMPVSDLRKQTSDVIRRIRQTGDIVYVTQYGRPTVVLVDYEQYEAMVEQLNQQTAPKTQQSINLLQSWIDEGDEEEQRETAEALVEGLNENRSSYRPHFPEQSKGSAW